MNPSTLLNDLDLETGILSSILNHQNFYEDAFRILKNKEVFSSPDHQQIFSECAAQFSDSGKVGYFSVAMKLKGIEKDKDWIGIVNKIKLSDGFLHGLTSKCLLLLEIASRRALFEANMEFQQSSLDSDKDIFETLAEQIKKTQGILDGLFSVQERTFAEQVKSFIDKKRQIALGNVDPGLLTGLDMLDSTILGLRNSQLIIIAARPGGGKTAMGLQLSVNIANAGYPIGFLSLEMSVDELIARMFADAAEINSRRIVKPSMEDQERMEDFQNMIAELPFHVNDRPGLTITEIEAIAQEWKRNKGIRMLVIDYVQIIKGDRKLSTYDRISESSTRLKALAKRLDIPVIALAQVGREFEKRGSSAVPQKSDLKESGQLEQDADVILMLRRPSEEDIAAGMRYEDDLEIHVRKNRDGSETPPTDPIIVRYIPKFNRIINA